MAEYLLLDRESRNPDTDAIDPDRLTKNTPWQKVDRMLAKGPENDPKFRSVVQNFNSEDIAESLNTIFMGGQDEFRRELAERSHQRNLEPRVKSSPDIESPQIHTGISELGL